MKNRTKAMVAAVAVCAALLVSAPAAQAAEYWASSSAPSKVRNNSGTVLGDAYGRGWNSTVYANSSATYRRVSGNYSIYVSVAFRFWQYNAQTKTTDWVLTGTATHNGNYSTSWTSNTRSKTLSPSASQSRIQVRACTEVPFLVPGNCTGYHYLTNTY